MPLASVWCTSVSRIALYWFSRTDYPRFRSKLIDGHLLPDDYGDWLDDVMAQDDQAIAGGHAPVRVPLSFEDVRDVCQRIGTPFDLESCVQIAKLRASRM